MILIIHCEDIRNRKKTGACTYKYLNLNSRKTVYNILSPVYYW